MVLQHYPTCISILFIIIAVNTLAHTQGAQQVIIGEGDRKQFEGSEHRAIADTGYIMVLEVGASNSTFIVVPTNITAMSYNFTNSQGTMLYTYGDIVAFSGDFFGPENELSIVCSASSDEEASALYFASFYKLWNTKDSSYINRIRTEMQNELDAVKASPGKYPYTAYAKLPESRWTSVFVSYLEMGLLLTSNHFSSCAVYTYSIGHQLALATASAAAATLVTCMNDTMSKPLSCVTAAAETMDLAYAMNAFADHFLTDLFSAGHIRTPRRQLTTNCMAPSSYVSTFMGTLSSGGLASQWMHDEDNRNGLLVTNKRGDVWVAFGDDSYFDVRNVNNQAMVQEAAQISRNEVFGAFAGTRSSTDPYGALLLIPDPSKLSQFAANNTCPLFYTDQVNYGVIYIRDNEQIRPDAWRVLQGFPGDPSLTTCNYTQFTQDECPHALLNKAEGYLQNKAGGYLPTWLNNAYTQKLSYSLEYQAWLTLRPDPTLYSPIPTIFFAAAGALLGIVLSIFFVTMEFFAYWHKKELSEPNFARKCAFLNSICCFNRGCSDKGCEWWCCDTEARSEGKWVMVSSFIPIALLCLLGLLLYLAIATLMPDLKSTLTHTVWAVYFVVGIVTAFITRNLCYNTARYIDGRRNRK